MSHFLAAVCIKIDSDTTLEAMQKGNISDVVNGKVEELLAPYDENIEVSEYEKDCYCIGNIALTESRKQADEKFGKDLDTVSREFNKSHKFGDENYYEDWEKASAPLFELRKNLFSKHPLKDCPDSSCGNCKGTGKYLTTYNPKSKWDWWRVGGRWDGEIAGVERVDDGEGGFNFGEQFEDHSRNSISAKAYIEAIKKDEGSVPYALVTSDGEWHEKGEMGWWGISINEKKQESWNEQVLALLEKEEDGVVVIGVDCHI